MFAKLCAEKGSPDDFHTIEKRRAREHEEMELA
jgi:hypothetical protein